MYKKHTKNPHKTHRKQLRLTFTHPTAPEFFSDFWICFNLTRPLNLHNYHLFTPHKINLKGEMNLKGQKMPTLVRMMQKWKKLLPDDSYDSCKGGGPGAVVKAACLKSRWSRVLTPLWHSSFKEPGFKCRILCLQGSVI